MTERVLCIYHANCADGLGAAWAVHRALGDNAEFQAAKYGIPILVGNDPNGVQGTPIRGRDILFVDFSAPLSVLHAMAQEARSVLILDHHKTAQEDLADLPPPCTMGIPNDPKTRTPWECWLEYGAIHKMEDVINRDEPSPRLAAIFDMNRSGAALTWDYLYGQHGPHGTQPAPRPRIIDLIEDRDLWRFKYGDETLAFHAVLTSYDITDLPAMFERLDTWNQTEWSRPGGHYEIIAEGRAILRAQRQAVASAVAVSRRTMKIAGRIIPVANVPPSMASDAGHLLIEQSYAPEFVEQTIVADNSPPFVATYHDGSDGRRHFSLRSPEGGADVGEIAKQMTEEFNEINRGHQLAGVRSKWTKHIWAGGGHVHAAGFDAPLGWEGEQ